MAYVPLLLALWKKKWQCSHLPFCPLFHPPPITKADLVGQLAIRVGRIILGVVLYFVNNRKCRQLFGAWHLLSRHPCRVSADIGQNRLAFVASRKRKRRDA